MRLGSLFAVVVLLVALAAPGASAHNGNCVGVGPALVTCTTGTHVFNTNFAHGVDLQASSLYTGRLESWLVWGLTGVRNIKCDILAGKIQGCATENEFMTPAHGESFQQLCFSMFYGTETAGGIGPWGCYITHD
jgi:hypothetical protein